MALPTRLVARWCALTLAAGVLAVPVAGTDDPAPAAVRVAAPAPTTQHTAATAPSTTGPTSPAPASTTVTAPAPTTAPVDDPPPTSADRGPAGTTATTEGTTAPTTLVPTAPSRLEGRVTDPDGSPLAGICVVAGPGETTRTGPDGRWALSIPGGVTSAHVAWTDCTGAHPGWLTHPPFGPVDLVPDATTSIDSTARRGGAVAATVRVWVGPPLAGVCVRLTSGTWQAQAPTGTDGVARFDTVPPGRVTAEVAQACGRDTWHFMGEGPANTVVAGAELAVDVQAGLLAALNDRQANPTKLEDGRMFWAFLDWAFLDPGERLPSCATSAHTGSVWFRREAGAATTFALDDLQGADQGSVLAVLVGPPGRLREVACRPIHPVPGGPLTGAVGAGEELWIQVTSPTWDWGAPLHPYPTFVYRIGGGT